jgi:hypothetical protein
MIKFDFESWKQGQLIDIEYEMRDLQDEIDFLEARMAELSDQLYDKQRDYQKLEELTAEEHRYSIWQAANG